MLSDLDIIRRLLADDLRHAIVITPMLFAPEQIGPSSVDVHLGTEFCVVERSNRDNFDPLMEIDQYQDWLQHVKLTSRYSVLEPFVLHRGEFALACTLEFICIPRDIVGHIDGRSSWARQGLKVHSTAGNIHPGSRGFVVFELENVGPVPILLYPGLAIAQLTFDRLDSDVIEDYSSRPSSKYASFAQNLFTAYPDDSTLRAMRAVKHKPHAVPTPWAVGGVKTSKQPNNAAALHQNLDLDCTLEMVLDSLQILDSVDLRIAAPPILALAGDSDCSSALDLQELELRDFLSGHATNIRDQSPHLLSVAYKILSALKRQGLRRE